MVIVRGTVTSPVDDAGNRTQRLKELECDSGSRLSGSRRYVAVSGVVRQIDADDEVYLSNLSGSGVRSSGWKLGVTPVWLPNRKLNMRIKQNCAFRVNYYRAWGVAKFYALRIHCT
jgi:hypothetical protein